MRFNKQLVLPSWIFVCFGIGLLFWSPTMLAQQDPGFPTEGDPGTTAPIDDWIAPMFVVGLLLAAFIYRRLSKDFT